VAHHRITIAALLEKLGWQYVAVFQAECEARLRTLNTSSRRPDST
jgi:hypothetical protein